MPEPGAGWSEPTRRLHLRWGTYRGRYLAGIALMFAGGVLVQFTSAYSLVVLPLGLFAHATGWCILPGIGWRRIFGAALGSLTAIVLLNGAPATFFLLFPLGGWLLVRQRPLLAYSTIVTLPLVSVVLAHFFPDYGWGVLVVTIAATVLVASAWLARSLAAMSGRSTAISR